MSVNAQAYEQYKNSIVETASPGRLLLMLYDAGIRNLDGARQAIDENNVQEAHKCLLRAQEIVVELMSTLNMDYDIAKNLYNLYEYFYRQLVQANIGKNAELVDEVRDFMAELRDTWREAIRGTGPMKTNAAGSKGFNLEG